MRELLAQYLDNRLSRRGFFRRMAAAGFTASFIESMLSELAQAETLANEGSESYRTATGTGGELLVEQLKAARVKYVFTNPGSTEVGLFDALADAPEIQLILGLHEGLVIAMADGYNQVTGETAFVNLHAIAGTAQASGQLVNAHRDHASMVVTAGLVDPTQFSDDLVLAPRPGFEQVDVNKQFSKISWEVRNPQSFPLAMRRAFKVASTPPGGPVYVALSTSALEAKNVSAEIIDQSKFSVPIRSRPAAADIEQVARWLLESTQPCLIVGSQLNRSGAVPQAMELSDLLAIPVSDFLGWFMLGANFPTQHPLYFSYSGMRYIEEENPFKTADMFLGLGAENFAVRALSTSAKIPTRGAWGPGNYPPPLPSAAKKVAIGIDTDTMARTEPVDLAIVADVGLALNDLLDSIRSLATKERLAAIRASRYDRLAALTARTRRVAEADVRANLGQNPMHPDDVAMLTESATDDDAITVHENVSHDMSRPYALLQNVGAGAKTRLKAAGGALGWGIGAAIGAKLGQPDRQVMLHIGDGSVMYSAAGFWTMARYKIPVLTIIWNNLNYQQVRFRFARYHGKMAQTDRYPTLFLGDPEIDFVKLSEAQGISSTKATTAGELEQALERGIHSTKEGRPFVIDARIRCIGAASESTWHSQFSLADIRTRKA
jgi:benzoylformate decarboxylase